MHLFKTILVFSAALLANGVSAATYYLSPTGNDANPGTSEDRPFALVQTGINKMADALDPEWSGPVPYTLLVDMDGTVLLRKTGIIDPLEVNNKILNVLGTSHSFHNVAKAPMK